MKFPNVRDPTEHSIQTVSAWKLLACELAEYAHCPGALRQRAPGAFDHPRAVACAGGRGSSPELRPRAARAACVARPRRPAERGAARARPPREGEERIARLAGLFKALREARRESRAGAAGFHAGGFPHQDPPTPGSKISAQSATASPLRDGPHSDFQRAAEVCRQRCALRLYPNVQIQPALITFPPTGSQETLSKES